MTASKTITLDIATWAKLAEIKARLKIEDPNVALTYVIEEEHALLPLEPKKTISKRN